MKRIGFKCTTYEGRSAFLSRHPLFGTQYKVGKIVKARHPKFPLWIVNNQNISDTTQRFDVGTHYDRVFVVEFDDKDVANFAPSLTGLMNFRSLNQAARKVIKTSSRHTCVQKLKVLCEADMSKFTNVKEAVNFYTKAFQPER